MKYLTAYFVFLFGLLCIALALPGCGKTGATGAVGPQGQSCTVEKVEPCEDAPEGGALITCGSTQVVVLNGADGESFVCGAFGSAKMHPLCKVRQ